MQTPSTPNLSGILGLPGRADVWFCSCSFTRTRFVGAPRSYQYKQETLTKDKSQQGMTQMQVAWHTHMHRLSSELTLTSQAMDPDAATSPVEAAWLTRQGEGMSRSAPEEQMIPTDIPSPTLSFEDSSLASLQTTISQP